MCVPARSWWSSRPRTAVRGRCLHHAWETLGKQSWTYQSAGTVFLSSSAMVETWPDFAKKRAKLIVCSEALFFVVVVISTGGFSPGKAYTAGCCFILRSYRYTQLSSPVTMSQTRDLPSNYLLVCGCNNPPYPASALHSGYGTPDGHNAHAENANETSRGNPLGILFFSACHFGGLLFS